MTMLVHAEKREGYLHCVAEPFDFSIEQAETFIQQILVASRNTGERLVFVDFTAIHEATPASLKAVVGFIATEMLLLFKDAYGDLPRIAVLGVAPYVSTYKPMEEILQQAGLPVRVFTQERAAREWLFAETRATQQIH